jgi:hypothetical protein
VVRMPISRLRQLAPMIQEAGLRVSKELGYQATARPTEPAVMQKIRGREAQSLAKAAL